MKNFTFSLKYSPVFFATTIAVLAVSELRAEPAASDGSIELLRKMDQAFVQVYDKVAPAVVIVKARQKVESNQADIPGIEDFFMNPPGGSRRRLFHGQGHPLESEGSGFIIRPEGYILTNRHVIENGSKIEVALKDGRKFEAKVVGADDKTDIAVLKIEAKGALPVAPLADSDAVKVGQLCFAIGIPYDQDYSFCAGHVSGKGRSRLMSTENRPMYEDYIQTDAFINPGNSGGPLFDIEGRVIGMNTLINGMSRNMAFAIPSNMLSTIGEQLIATGKVSRPWLGVRIETLGDTPSLAEQIKGVEKGAVIVTIEPDSPAYQSNLRPADVVTSVDGVPTPTAHDLQKEVLKKKIGQTVALTVWRNGKSTEISVRTGELPGSDHALAVESSSSSEKSGKRWFGIGFQTLTPELAQRMNLKTTNGVIVTDVEPGSPAAEADIQRGDLITEIDQQAANDAEAAGKLFSSHPKGKAVLLFIERKGQRTYTVIKPAA